MDFRCPECGNDESSYGMKLKFSVCGHHVCEKCFKKLFRNNLEVKCPNCDRMLKINDFAYKYQEDYDAENDREVRRRILSILNKTCEDFPSLSEYNDYLEEIEEIIEDLVKGLNEECIKERLESEKNARKSNILKIDARKEKLMKEMYKNAVLTDFIYNERWADEAEKFMRLNEEEVKVEEEAFVMKQMPLKVDDLVIDKQSAQVETMTEDIKRLFLSANGFDYLELERTGKSELIEGIR